MASIASRLFPDVSGRKSHAQSKPNKVIAAKEKKGSHGLECEEHLRGRLRVTILIHEVDAHDNASSQGSDTTRENLSIDQVLDAVPAHGPADPGKVNKHNRPVPACRCETVSEAPFSLTEGTVAK
jgi:hypothetical protein